MNSKQQEEMDGNNLFSILLFENIQKNVDSDQKSENESNLSI